MKRLKGNGKEMIECDGCNKKYKRLRHFRMFKGKWLCSNCFMGKAHKIGNFGVHTGMSYEKAVNKIYEVQGYKCKNGRIQCSVNFPSILTGHKFKIVVIK